MLIIKVLIKIPNPRTQIAHRISRQVPPQLTELTAGTTEMNGRDWVRGHQPKFSSVPRDPPQWRKTLSWSQLSSTSGEDLGITQKRILNQKCEGKLGPTPLIHDIILWVKPANLNTCVWAPIGRLHSTWKTAVTNFTSCVTVGALKVWMKILASAPALVVPAVNLVNCGGTCLDIQCASCVRGLGLLIGTLIISADPQVED